MQKKEISEEEVSFSHHSWNRPLGYGFKFDLVQLHRARISAYVEGNRFYSNPQNQLYDWPILKLHGSLNWFRFLPFRSFPSFDETDSLQPEWMKNAVIHVEGHWWMHRPPDFQGWFVDPLIITPVLNKEALFHDPIYRRVFAPLWSRALEALSKCRKLVVVGYSFSPTDFRTRKLFLEAFSSNTLEEFVIVNPNSTAAKIAKELCHFNEAPTVFPDLQSFVSEVHKKNRDVYAGYESGVDLGTRFEEGKKLVKILDEAGVQVAGAFWLLLPRPIRWKLFIVSPLIKTLGEGETRSRITTANSSSNPASKLDARELVLLDPSAQLVDLLKHVIRTGPGITGTRIGSAAINDFTIEDMYVYRMQ